THLRCYGVRRSVNSHELTPARKELAKQHALAWHNFLGFGARRADSETDPLSMATTATTTISEPVPLAMQHSIPLLPLPRLEFLGGKPVGASVLASPRPPRPQWASPARVQGVVRRVLGGENNPNPQLSVDQQLALDYVAGSRGQDRLFLVLPTGAGKSMLY